MADATLDQRVGRSVETLLQHGPQQQQQQRKSTESTRRHSAMAKAMAASSSQDDNAHGNPHRLQIPDRQLAETARLSAASIQWESLNAGDSMWTKKKTLGEFGIYTRRDGDVHHLMASGSVHCSLTEMQHVLRTTTTEQYVGTMKELYGDQFLMGSVVHRIDTSEIEPAAPSPPHHTPSPVCRPPTGFDLSVKAATFAKAHLFARNEQWFYLEFFQLQPEHQRFVLTMRSLCPEDVLLASANTNSTKRESSSSSKNQLQEMTMGYAVVADENHHNLVRIVFYAQFVGSNSSLNNSQKKHHASTSTTKARLLKMAKATCCLPMIVRRRRLGMQVFADPKAFAPSNTHCICCKIVLPMLSEEKRCHLCGYRVCIMCSTKEQIGRPYGRVLELVRVCIRCTQRVHAANYDKVPCDDAPISSLNLVKPNPPNQVPMNHLLANLLHASFANAKDTSHRQAVVQVIKSFLEQEETSSRRSGRWSLRSSSSSSSKIHALRTPLSPRAATECSRTSTLPPTSRNEIPERDHQMEGDDVDYYYLNGLESRLHVKEIALEECVLSNAEARTYPLSYKDDDPDGVPHHPVPKDEERRLQLVHQRRLTEMLNVPELEIICSIASSELQCSTGLVTIIGKEVVHIIASSDAGYKNQVLSRDESLCSHLVMSDKPLALGYAGADIRFSKMASVEEGRIGFYCGFPITMSDNIVVGSMCCVDSEPHDLTQAQYAMMAQLTSTASKVMEMHASANAA